MKKVDLDGKELSHEVKTTDEPKPRKPKKGLRWTKERKKARKRAKQRYREACMENKEYQQLLQSKGTLITECFQDRVDRKLESVSDADFQASPEDCEWCGRFRQGAFHTCINCGKKLK